MKNKSGESIYKYKQIDTKKSTSKEIHQFLELKNKKSGKRKYQIEAYDSLNKTLLDDDSRVAGMLILPTGGGKTRVSVSWAIDKAINDGYKILWIAHRHMLLEQAYETFMSFSGLCTAKDRLNLRIVSGNSKHASLSSIDFKKDDVVVASIGSMHKKLRKKFRSVKKLLVIVDEAHHSTAPTYKEWIGLPNNKYGWFRKQFEKGQFESLKILGLTATPINANSQKEEELKAIYDGKEALFKISTAELMKKGILSQPILNPISTENIVDIDVKEFDDETKIEREKSINKKLAENPARNHHIVETYKKSYRDGKTLIFAVDKNHAEMLKVMFNEHNIECETIYSGKDYKDSSFQSNDEVISKFRDNDSSLNVLVNINILTEGSDIPNIQNLFITRVVGSETLYTQMIGRALRGVDSGGTKHAHIVTFEDNIKNFDVLSLKDLFAENGWEESEILERSFKDIEIRNDKKYSINQIQEILETEHTDHDEYEEEILDTYRYALIDSALFSDERIISKIDQDKLEYYLLGLRDTRKDTKRWSFTKEKGQFSFKTKKQSDIQRFDKDSEDFYFIVQKQSILTPSKMDMSRYWQEIYQEFMESSDLKDVEMLPSYGMPIGEYQLCNTDDEVIDTIPVFKFQANSYERFLDAYFDSKFDKSLSTEEIKERYFSESNNFIPIRDRVLESLLSYLECNERPIMIEYEFEKMNEVEDIIDNIARQVAGSKPLDLDTEYHDNKILHSRYTREVFRDEIFKRSDILKGYKEQLGVIEEIPREKLNLKRFSYQITNDFNQIHNLDELYKSASKIACKNLKVKKLSHSPKEVKWTKQAYKGYFGIARGIDVYTKHIYKNSALLEINSILCSSDIPSFAIEFVLYHEILHFELKMGHTKEFRDFEEMHPYYEEAWIVLSEVGDWINMYWEGEELSDKPTQETPEYSWKVYEKGKKSNKTINKFLDKKSVKLPTISDMKTLYQDEEFRESLLKNETKWFLCSDKKTSFCFEDGSSDIIEGFNFQNKGKRTKANLHLHLLVMEES